MRLGFQNHLHNISESRSDLNANFQENDSLNDESSFHQELDNNSNNNNKLNKSYTEEESSSKPKKTTNQIKEKTYYQFITAILHDDKDQAKKILDSSSNQAIVDHPSLEGLTPIQYAAYYGSIECFKFLMEKKVDIERKVEGLNLIHLSLCRAIFKKDKEKCVKMFNYIYEKFPKEKEFKDRLGRTFLHIIFEYDFIYALNKIIINLDELFIQDNNGDFVINYVYIYNSNQCFWKVAKDPEFLGKMYKEIRIRNESNKIPKERFLEKLFIHHNFYSIAIIIVNCKMFINELIEDLNTLRNFYISEMNANDNIHDYNNLGNKDIFKIKDNLDYALNIVNIYKNNEDYKEKFNFPQKIRFFSGIIYNFNCIHHVKLPEEPLKHLMARISMFENSDRLSCLIDAENGIILNDQVFNYIEGITYEQKISKNLEYSQCENIIIFKSERKSCLNDILKCHDLNYIQKLKDICYAKQNNSSFKKHENHEKSEKGLNIPKILSKMDTTNPLYKNISNTNYQSHFRKLDIDTYVNEYSFENIFNTSGCVLDAVDYVLQDKIKNALVLIRPPGHNAGYYGPVENKNNIISSSGFCLVNNVAIGAAYAKNKYRNEIVKVAIFDFDAHHGNGTEEIVQMLNAKSFEKKFCYDKLCELKTINVKQINWVDGNDAKNVLYISTHIYDEENEKNRNNFYPYSGNVDTNTDKTNPIYPGGILNIPLNSINKKCISGEEYRNIIKTKVIPRLYEFKPDIIFLSAGFDAHENEIINQKYMNLNEFDFSFITQQMQFVANKFCRGRLISVLEGGYNVSTGITISSFAQSVFTHARFLNLSLNMFQISDLKLTGYKRQPQYDEENDKDRKVNNIKDKNEIEKNKEDDNNIDKEDNNMIEERKIEEEEKNNGEINEDKK